MSFLKFNLEVLVKNVADDSDCRICLVLAAVIQHQILVDWNNAWIEYPGKKTIHQIFEDQVSQTSDKVAVILPCVSTDTRTQFSYQELNDAYLQERLAFMLENIQSPVLLNRSYLCDRLPAYQAKILYDVQELLIGGNALSPTLIKENFFELRGTSLPRLRGVARIHKELGSDIHAVKLHRCLTIRTLGQSLDRKIRKQSNPPQVEKQRRKGSPQESMKTNTSSLYVLDKSSTIDFTIIGGGIVGLSTAMALCHRYPNSHIAVLEKEDRWACHQTGNNSGVIHSGIYYKPGSLKAKFCREGCNSIVQFCQEHGIDYEVCGKVIVATESEELILLENLYQRGLEHGIKVIKLTAEQVKKIEPHVNCLAGIQVFSTGIVDYKQVCQKYANLIESQGGKLYLNTKIERIVERKNHQILETNNGSFKTRFTINCAGLHSDRVAKLGNLDPKAKIVPFRGEYYELKPEKRYLVKHLIYPVPNPNFPFLGVHFTRMIDGSIHAGPNAVLSFKREGYRKTDFDLKDFVEVMTYPGFWKLAAKHSGEGLRETIRSFSKAAFVRSLQRLIPEIQSDDLVPTHAGVRAQALMNNGELVDDFLIVKNHNSIHVCNAPSPAATSSIEIGKAIAITADKEFFR
jgi:(S)-2-hydroxyglutarate dehydrogenase